MNVFFVYDTLHCKEDEDDPKDAIIYFFPLQVSESHHYFLCCQLIGVAKFLKSTFSAPSIIVLDQGKFAFLWSGHYLLVLGANTDASSNVLKNQLSFLYGIFSFYHGSINNVLKVCGNNRKEFLSTMELAWSRYITLSQCFTNIFQLSMNALPLKSYKKNSNVVSTANRLLHICQLSSSVTAGCVFHNSRVLSTQFLPQLTNYLSLLSNTNAAAPVTNAIHFMKNLPPDVELKYIYLKSKVVSNILKYNHKSVGSRIRIKTSTKNLVRSFSPSLKENQTSGSEGDVDSGNCSENVQSSKDEVSFARKSKRYSSLKLPKQKKLCNVSCCVGHSRLFEKNLLGTRNSSVKFYINHLSHQSQSSKTIEREELKIPEALTHHKKGNNLNSYAVNVLCHSHAQNAAFSFVSKCKLQHTSLVSCCDLEFKCSMCTNYPSSAKVNNLSLKQWNSDINVSGFTHHQCICDGQYYSELNEMDNKEEISKIQVLKCRSSSETNSRLRGSRRPLFLRRATIDAGIPDYPNKSSARNPIYDCMLKSGDDGNSSTLEENEFQKCVLYVQRYGSSTLVLLLHKVFDEKVINYLWNCGFTILRELEYNAEKHEMEKSYELEPSFYLLLYNYTHKVLKEFPHFPSLLLTEKYCRKTIQQIQEDFQIDPHFKSICLLSSNQSVFACQSDPNLVFYLQPETDSRKVEPLYHLSKKASQRLGKYFNLPL